MSLIIQRTPMDPAVSMCMSVCLRPISQRAPMNTVNEASISTHAHTHTQVNPPAPTKYTYKQTHTASASQGKDEKIPCFLSSKPSNQLKLSLKSVPSFQNH